MAVHNVVCMKWGDKYPAYYVNRLYLGVKRFLPGAIRFVCFTDNADGIIGDIEIQPLPTGACFNELQQNATPETRIGSRIASGTWRKVGLFMPGLAGLAGPTLGLDLDVVITGSIESLFAYAPGKMCLRKDWQAERRFKSFGNSSVFRFDPQRHTYIYEEFAADPVGCAMLAKGQEQRHVSWSALAHGDLEYYPREWIASYKVDSTPFPPFNFFVEPKIPAGGRVVCFHGEPKMEEALRGYNARWLHASLPARWLENYWLQEPR